MIRFLDDLVLLKEVDDIAGAKHNSTQLKKLYPEKIIIIRRTSFIYRDVLCETAKAAVTPLDDYVQLGALIENMRISKNQFLKRLRFMEKTGTKIFDYIKLNNIYFIKITQEFKHLAQNFQPFVANYDDASNLVHCLLLGDLKIGFY